MLISVAILACGLFLTLIGYKATKEKRVRLLPINRGEFLEGEAAVKAGKQILTIGLLVSLVGLFFVFSGFF